MRVTSGIPGEIPFGVCTLPRLNMPTADRKAVFNGVKISRGKQGSGTRVLGSGIWDQITGLNLRVSFLFFEPPQYHLSELPQRNRLRPDEIGPG